MTEPAPEPSLAPAERPVPDGLPDRFIGTSDEVIVTLPEPPK